MSTFEGACACGEISYTIRDEQLKEVAVCHCKTCQAWSGGVYLYVDSKNVTVNGEVKSWMSSEFCERAFCGKCGSTLYCRLHMEGPMNGSYHVAAGTLKDWKGLQLRKEIFIDRKPTAYSLEVGAGTPATCKMTKRECFTLWGVPLSDDEAEDTSAEPCTLSGSKRKSDE